MRSAYLLAYKLGIPFIIQPDWNKSAYFLTQGETLLEEGRRLQREVIEEVKDKDLVDRNSLLRDNNLKFSKGTDAIKNGNKISQHGVKLYLKAVARELGPKCATQIDWSTGEILCQP